MTVVHGLREQALGWQDIPVDTRSALAFQLGAGVVQALRQDAEIPGSVAVRLLLDDGRWAFVRALPALHPSASGLRAEAETTALLPRAAPVPEVFGVVDGEWLAVVFSDLDGARVNLRPGSPDCSAMFTAIGRAVRTLTPCPVAGAPDALTELDGLLSVWRTPGSLPSGLDPWLESNVDSLAVVETAWHPWSDGDTLLHNDLRPDTLVRTGTGQVLITGWRRPLRGAAWLDTTPLVPYLLVAGHTIATAEKLVLSRPELRAVPAWAVTGYAAALCGYWQFASRCPEPPGSAGLREQQRKIAAAALRWVRHRTRW
ncbi:phosphotransferase [Sciscionella marina]|uniref:phosphotransferase n=1 Tax=Sciscionella marina TaxID=508770 RepID=UPI00036E8102|nr:phosphotransferase [Sciscionella marina]